MTAQSEPAGALRCGRNAGTEVLDDTCAEIGTERRKTHANPYRAEV